MVADHGDALAGEKELEVFQPDPGALQQVHRERDLPRRQLVVQEGHHDAEHGKVPDQQQPDGSRQHHRGEPECFLPGSGRSAAHAEISLAGFCLQRGHGTICLLSVVPGFALSYLVPEFYKKDRSRVIISVCEFLSPVVVLAKPDNWVLKTAGICDTLTSENRTGVWEYADPECPALYRK